MTVAEMKYGIENSKTIELMGPIVEAFIAKFIVIPIYSSLNVYAIQASIKCLGSTGGCAKVQLNDGSTHWLVGTRQ